MSRRALARASWALMAWLSLLTAVTSFRYVLHPEWYDDLFRDKYIGMLGIVLAHGTSSVVALAVGPLQFIERLRGQLPRLHRRLGYLYCVAVMVGAATGLCMGYRAYGGVISQVGFCVMSALWLMTLVLAIRSISLGRAQSHRRWMVRNFALTFAAVLIRVYLNAFQLAGLRLEDIYPYVPWLAWVPALVFAELLARPSAWRQGGDRVWGFSPSAGLEGT